MRSFSGSWRRETREPEVMQGETVWSDGRLTLSGTAVWEDPVSGLVVAGEYVPVGEPWTLAKIGEAFLQQGIAVGLALPGMFTLAFYEKRSGRLTLVRDPVGARTLYYSLEPGGDCRFAARLRQLRQATGTREISLAALRDYLVCAYVPGAQTLWKGLFELRPGEALTLPEGKAIPYFLPEEGPAETETPLEVYAERLRPLLEAAVAARLPETGTLGASLSGGVDSSLVVALAARQRGGRNLHTYSLHFGHDLPNELEFSSLVAEHCGTRHRILEFPGKRIQKHLEETIALLDDPIGDPLTVPNLLMAQAARQEVGVLLNGEGGDPVFGGPKNIPMLLHELYESGGTGEEELLKLRLEAYFRSYQKCYDDLQRLLTPEARQALLAEPPMENLLLPYLGDNAPMRQFLNRLMQINVVFKGADHILTKVNNLTTAVGLIGHSPLFDPGIVRAGFAVPGVYKLSGTREKAVLKQAVADSLPEAILTRPKSGMLVPVQKWFKDDLRRYAIALLLSRGSRIRPYLNQKVIEEWLSYRSAAPFARQGVKIWLALTLELWLRPNE